MTLINQIRELKNKPDFRASMLGLMNLDILTLEQDLTVVAMPHKDVLTSGFHGNYLHLGALMGLASSAAFLHALLQVRPGATEVEQLFNVTQPIIIGIEASLKRPAVSSVTAFSTVEKWDQSVADNLYITTSIRTSLAVEVARITTRHFVPAGSPIPADVPLTLL